MISARRALTTNLQPLSSEGGTSTRLPPATRLIRGTQMRRAHAIPPTQSREFDTRIAPSPALTRRHLFFTCRAALGALRL